MTRGELLVTVLLFVLLFIGVGKLVLDYFVAVEDQIIIEMGDHTHEFPLHEHHGYASASHDHKGFAEEIHDHQHKHLELDFELEASFPHYHVHESSATGREVTWKSDRKLLETYGINLDAEEKSND